MCLKSVVFLVTVATVIFVVLRVPAFPIVVVSGCTGHAVAASGRPAKCSLPHVTAPLLHSSKMQTRIPVVVVQVANVQQRPGLWCAMGIADPLSLGDSVPPMR